jgi:hypothetical protein
MTFDGLAGVAVVVRLDMMFPSLKADNPNIRPKPGFRYCQNLPPMQRQPKC